MSNEWRLQQPCQPHWTETLSAMLAVSELYDPIRQVLLKLSELSEKSRESRRQATFLTLYSRARYGTFVNFVTVATKS